MKTTAPLCPLEHPALVEVSQDPALFDALLAELGDPRTGRRPWTPPEPVPGTGRTKHRVQRVCNGCGYGVGDVELDEIDLAGTGLPLPDVRGECLLCCPLPVVQDLT